MTTKQVKFTQGADVTLTAKFKDHESGDPINLSGFTGATGYFPPVDTSSDWVAVTGSLVSEDLGTVRFELNDEVTQQIAAGTDQDIEFEVDHGVGGAEKIVEVRTGILEVKERVSVRS